MHNLLLKTCFEKANELSSRTRGRYLRCAQNWDHAARHCTSPPHRRQCCHWQKAQQLPSCRCAQRQRRWPWPAKGEGEYRQLISWIMHVHDVSIYSILLTFWLLLLLSSHVAKFLCAIGDNARLKAVCALCILYYFTKYNCNDRERERGNTWVYSI